MTLLGFRKQLYAETVFDLYTETILEIFNLRHIVYLLYEPEACWEPYQEFKMELLVKIVNDFQP